MELRPFTIILTVKNTMRAQRTFEGGAKRPAEPLRPGNECHPIASLRSENVVRVHHRTTRLDEDVSPHPRKPPQGHPGNHPGNHRKDKLGQLPAVQLFPTFHDEDRPKSPRLRKVRLETTFLCE